MSVKCERELERKHSGYKMCVEELVCPWVKHQKNQVLTYAIFYPSCRCKRMRKWIFKAERCKKYRLYEEVLQI